LPPTHEEGTAAPSRRLAFLDMDWSHVRAKDIVAIARSLCPAGGRCVGAAVYASNYGVKAMEDERRFGPDRDVFDSQEPVGGTSKRERITSGFDPEALRRYELSKVRRYFAVATFDSARTAEHVYSNDGVELEATSTPLSLAVVEDAESFDPERLRDESFCDKDDALASYEPPPAYCLAARQQTKVECSWDADEPERKSAFVGAFRDADEANLTTYLADSSDDDDDDGEEEDRREERRRRLRAQLGLPVNDDDDDDDEEPPAAQEAKKTPLIDDALEDYAADDEDSKPTTTTLRGKKKKKQRKDDDDQPADDFFVAAAADDDEEGRDYDAKMIQKAERLASKAKLRGKRKRQRDTLLAANAKSTFEFDAHDDRFSAVLEGTDDTFGVDPTSPDYKETPAMKVLLAEQTKRRRARRQNITHKGKRS